MVQKGRGAEGAIGSASGNLLADLTFKGLAPNKPTSLDPDEQKAYYDAIDRTAIAAKLLAPITVMLATGGSAVATGTAIGTSSAVINENHHAHALLTEQEQELANETAIEYAKALIDLQDRYGDVVETFSDGAIFIPGPIGGIALGVSVGLRGVRLTRDLLSGDPERQSMAQINLITSVTRSKFEAFCRLAKSAQNKLSGKGNPGTLKAEGSRGAPAASTSKREAAGPGSRTAENPATATSGGTKARVKIKTVPLSAEQQRAYGMGSGGASSQQKGGVNTRLMEEVPGSKPAAKPAASNGRNAGASSSKAGPSRPAVSSDRRTLEALGLESGPKTLTLLEQKIALGEWRIVDGRTIRKGQEWKTIIHGRGQKTKTPGHAMESAKTAVGMAKSGEYQAVHLDRGYHRILRDAGYDIKLPVNRRPDVVGTKHGGREFDVVEVMSKTDKEAILRSRNLEVTHQLRSSGIQVNEAKVREIPGWNYEKGIPNQ